MNVTKEQIFFLAVASLIGWMSYSRVANPYKAIARPPGKKLAEVESRPVPLDLKPLADDQRLKSRGRDIFAQPKDWVPLDPLDLELPPVTQPPFVPPFPEPSLGVSLWMHYARSEPKIPTDLHGLQAAPATTDAAPADDASAPDGEGQKTDSQKSAKSDKPAAKSDAKTPPPAGKGAAAPKSAPTAAPAEKPAPPEDRSKDYPKRFDQIVLKDAGPQFGLIRNKDKWNLQDRPGEAIEWQQMLVSKGELGMNIAQIDRNRVDTFRFAETPINNFYVAKRELKLVTDNPGKRIEFVERWLDTARQDPALYPALQTECEDVLKLPSVAQTMGARLGKVFELLGETYGEQLDFEQQLRSYQRGIEQGIEYSGLYRSYARFLERYDLFQQSDAMFAKAIKADPNDAVAARDYGYFLLRRQRPEEARQQFENAMKPSGIPTELRVSARCGLASAYLMLGNLDLAMQQAQSAQSLLPPDLKAPLVGPDPATVLGAVAIARADDARAKDSFDAATSEMGRAGPLIQRAIALTRAGQLQEAYDRLGQALELDPTLAPRALRAKGAVEERAGLMDAAIESYQSALDRDPDNAYGMYLLGRALRLTGDLERAEQLMTQALAREGRFVGVLNEQGTLAYQLDRAADAQRFFKESLLRDPNRAEIRYLLGLAELRSGQTPLAREDFKKALALRDNKWAAAKNGLAYCAYKDGASDEAMQSLLQAKDLLAGDQASLDFVYASRYLKEIQQNLAKEQWIDNFAWKTSSGNGWTSSERYGVLVRPLGNAISFNGTQKEDGAPTQLVREFKGGSSLVSFEAELAATDKNVATFGISIMQEQPVQGEMSPYNGIAIACDPSGLIRVQVRESNRNRFQEEEGFKPLKDADQEVRVDRNEPLKLAILRVPDKKGYFEVRVNDQAKGDPIEIAPLGASANKDFKIAIFTRAKAGALVDISATRARLVRTKG